jgi:hypothetical protein
MYDDVFVVINCVCDKYATRLAFQMPKIQRLHSGKYHAMFFDGEVSRCGIYIYVNESDNSAIVDVGPCKGCGINDRKIRCAL